ncbi:MAG: c-type cytochrome [Rhodobacter sp.]|nr:c-type cytochrome [Rhodobacter sp.]
MHPDGIDRELTSDRCGQAAKKTFRRTTTIQPGRAQAMKKYETVIGAIFGLGFGGLAFLAVFVLGVLIYKGPAANPMPAPPAEAAAIVPDSPAPQQAEPAEQATSTGAEVVAEAPAAGIDLAAGEKVFKACKACHKAEKGAKHATGPALWGVFGGPIAAQEVQVFRCLAGPCRAGLGRSDA